MRKNRAILRKRVYEAPIDQRIARLSQNMIVDGPEKKMYAPVGTSLDTKKVMKTRTKGQAAVNPYGLSRKELKF